MSGTDKNDIEDLIESYKQYILRTNSIIGQKRLSILEEDPSAPICINCKHCQQIGVRFHCPLFALEEDGKVVGNWGDVYYVRGKIRKVYPNVPLKPEDCEEYVPLTPFRTRDNS